MSDATEHVAALAHLNPKERIFCQVRASGRTIEEAAKRARYSPGYGRRLVTKDHILEAIQLLQEQAAQALDLKPELVLGKLAEIAFSNVADCFDAKGHLLPIKDLPPTVQRAIASVKIRRVGKGSAVEQDVVELRMINKLPALEKLGQHLKLFTEVHEIVGSDEMIKRIHDGRARAFARWQGHGNGGETPPRAPRRTSKKKAKKKVSARRRRRRRS